MRCLPLVLVLTACGAASSASSSPAILRTRLALPGSEPLMLGIATAEDGHQGFSNVFFFNVDPTGTRCAPVDTRVDHGAVCTLRDCRDADASALPERLLDFGSLTLTSPGRHAAALHRDARGVYVVDAEVGERWSSGDAVHVALAGGADGPSASADLVVPIFPHLLAPPLPPPGTPMPLMPESPLAVRWEPFDGIAFAFLSLVPPDEGWWLHHLELECLTDGADGAMTIPPALLTHFRPDTEYFANFAFGARVFVDVMVGTHRVRMVAETARSIDVEYE